MPPAKRELAPDNKNLLKIGSLVHVVSGGRTYQNYEVLDFDDRFILVRANIQNAPQTEIVLLPYTSIEMLGLPGGR